MAYPTDDKCIFCMIVKGTIPSAKLYESDHSLAFLDIHPVSEGHTQIIPKYHAATLTDLPDSYLQDILPIAKKVAAATGAKNYNIMQNNGKLAFQHVDHVHFHVIPKSCEADGLVLNIDDNWPQREATKVELQMTLQKMKCRM